MALSDLDEDSLISSVSTVHEMDPTRHLEFQIEKFMIIVPCPSDVKF